MGASRIVRSVFIVLSAAVVLFTPASVGATSLGVDFVGTLNDAFTADLTLGWSFTVNQPIDVTGLGFFDDFSRFAPGLRQDHLVSLWTDGGSLLAQTTITNASTHIASTAAAGVWFFNAISPVFLLPGNYVIGAHNAASTACATCDDFRYFDTATTSSFITFNNALDISGSAFPTNNPNRNDGYFGPNFEFDPATPVPEPTSLLLLGSGLIGAVAGRSRRKHLQALFSRRFCRPTVS
jgi:hypothetical protein